MLFVCCLLACFVVVLCIHISLGSKFIHFTTHIFIECVRSLPPPISVLFSFLRAMFDDDRSIVCGWTNHKILLTRNDSTKTGERGGGRDKERCEVFGLMNGE